MEKKNQGITLVALVITVIVLLILAGTAISIAINGGDIFSKTTQARAEWNQAVAREETSMLDMLDMLETVDDITNPERQALKLLVNSGDDGEVFFPTLSGTVDWGDGTVVDIGKNDEYVQSSYKVADANGIKIAAALDIRAHIYDTSNKDYIVTITGIRKFECNIGGSTNEKIIKVLQWGQMELECVDFSYCTNLTSIASPTSRSFSNTELSYITFRGCTSLTSIPADLFKYCTNMTWFEETFMGCTSLTSIPAGLFDNCTNANSFIRTFYECTSLTGPAIPLWERMENGASYNYESDGNRKPNGKSCYYNCTGLTNYSSIPEYWRKVTVWAE